MRAPAAVSSYLDTVRGFNRNVRLLFAYMALLSLGGSGIASLLINLYLVRLGYGPQFIGLANALMMLAMGSLSLPAGELGRRFTNRRVMIAGAWLSASALIALAPAWLIPAEARSAWVLVQLFLVGVGFTTVNVNSIPFLAGWAGDKESNHAFSVFSAVMTAGGFLGALVGGLLPGLAARVLGLGPDDPIPYGLGVLIGGLMMIPAGVALLATREPLVGPATAKALSGGEQIKPGAAPARERAPWRTIVLLSLTTFVSFLGMGAAMTFWNVYFDQALHVSTATIGGLSAAGQLAGIPAALAAPLIMARLGRPRTYTLGLLAGAASIVSLGLASSALWAGASYVGRLLAFSVSVPAINIIAQTSVSPRWRSLMSGAGGTASTIGMAVTAFGGGYVIAALGFRPLFLGAAVSVAAAAALFWVWFGRTKGVAAEPTPAAAAG